MTQALQNFVRESNRIEGTLRDWMIEHLQSHIAVAAQTERHTPMSDSQTTERQEIDNANNRN